MKVKEETMHGKNFNCILHRVVEVLHFRDTGTFRKVLWRAEYTHARTHTRTDTHGHTRTDTHGHTHIA